MMLRRILMMSVLIFALAACGGAEDPLPTLASDASDDTTTETESSDNTETTNETADTTTDDSAVEFEIGITDDLSAPEFVGSGDLTVTATDDAVYNMNVDLPEGWSIDGDTVSNGDVSITILVDERGGEALSTVLGDAAGVSADDVIVGQNMDYMILPYVFDDTTGTFYVTFNTNGTEFNLVYTAIVTGGASAIQANLADVLAIVANRALTSVE